MSISSRSFSTQRSTEDLHRTEDANPASVRAQRAVVRTLTDAIEQLTAAGDTAEGLRQQLDEELDRLGFQLLAAEQR